MKGKRLDLNKASTDDLKQARGISDTLADKIIEYRDANGGFDSIDDLVDVEGLSETRKKELSSSIEVREKEEE